jgi:hypothetical protein
VFLLPILFHSHLGLPLTIVLVVALIVLRVVLRNRRRSARPGGGAQDAPGTPEQDPGGGR